MTRRPILVDCDTGIDDALALAYLLAEPTVEIVGVTTVSGNTDAARAAANTLSLFQLAGVHDIPVAVGAHDFRGRAYAGGAPHVHGHDGVGGIAWAAAARAHDARPAVELIDHLASRHPDLTVLALGPLTNLAAYAEAPGVAAFDRLVVMGGAFAHSGNVTAWAEANIHNDPESAAIVFAQDWDTTLMPLDVTMTQTLDATDLVRLEAIPGVDSVAVGSLPAVGSARIAYELAGDTPIDAFGVSVKQWPAFADSAQALDRLKQRFRLGVITNCDDDLFAASNEKLGTRFDWVITAQQAEGYKPRIENFEYAFAHIDVPRERILHVAQSLFHDHVPAKAVGMTTVWIDRRQGQEGFGATPPASAQPDLVVPDMRSFAALATG